MVRGKLVFITGGVRSGKSSFAEQYLWMRGKTKCVCCFGVAVDGEMKERIKRHQDDRKNTQPNGKRWSNHDILNKSLPQIQRGDAILWDCVTTWLANEL